MKIIIINGSSKAGKDKFVKLFKYEHDDLRVKNYSSIDKVKSIAEIAFGWNGKKDEKSRKMLSDIKKAWSEFNNGPTNDIINKIKIDIQYSIDNKKDKENIYFVHIREPEEINKIKNIYKNECITLLIKKDNNGDIPNNYSDKNVDNYKYDIIIENNGNLDDLKSKVDDFYKKISKDYAK